MVKTADVKIQIFADLDGVLADFDRGVKKVTGKLPGHLSRGEMWGKISDKKIIANSPHHAILHTIANEEPLSKDLRQRTKAIRLLDNLGLLDQKRMTITNKGFQILFRLDGGEDYVSKLDFYNQLDWMPDGKILWEYVSGHEPIINTGLPHGDWAESQKRSWCARELGPDVPVLVGMARDKANSAMKFLRKTDLEGSVIFDDRSKHQKTWEAAGGVWIPHTDAVSTIAALRKMGI